MLSTRKGQSIIEYATMAALITVGVLVMGPYVVRSINALFKSIEEDVNDSLNEDIHQASPGYSLPECTCGELIDQECGGWTCNDYQMYRKRTCNPTGCEILFLQARNVKIQMDDCEYRDNCCDEWKEKECGANMSPYIDGGCPDGEMGYYHECGETRITEYACQSQCQGEVGCAPPVQTSPFYVGHWDCFYYCHADGDPSTPVDATNPLNPAPPSRTNWCPNATTGLPGKRPVNYVDSCSGTKCEAKCKPSFILKDGFCQCPDCSLISADGERCICDWTYSRCVYQDGCPAGSCYYGGCGSSQCALAP